MIRGKEYRIVESLDEAYKLNLKKSNVVVGGMMWLKMWNNYKMTLIDLSNLGLNQIEETEDAFMIGSMCTLRQLEMHKNLNHAYSDVFQKSLKNIVGTQFRNMATIGGSVWGKFGFSDVITALLMLDTSVELYKGGIIPLSEFLQRGNERDILVHIIIKKELLVCRYHTSRLTKTDFPLIACGVSKTENNYRISIGARPGLAKVVIVEGMDQNPEEIAKTVIDKMQFGDNLRGSASYRKHLACVHVKRLIEALNKEEL